MSETPPPQSQGPRRTHLGSNASLTSRSSIYLGQEGIEIDEHTGFASGQRTRVLFDEVQLVTLDRRRSAAGVWISGGGILFVAAICAMVLVVDKSGNDGAMKLPVFALTTLITSSPFWIYLLGQLIWGTDYVTVFGKRSTAKMSFSLRKARARTVFALVRDRIAAAQNTKSASPAMASETSAPGLPIA